MSKRKFTRFFNQLVREFFQLQKLLLRSLRLFLRSFLVSDRRQRRQEGFVLPTTALVLVVVSIVIAALILRSISRTNQVIGERQQQVIYNAASPAIDRAKAKLEYLFSQNGNLPVGVAPENTMIANMHYDTTSPLSYYTLPGEQRLKLYGSTTPDNAWIFTDSATGNKIAYSILIATQDPTGSGANITSQTSIKAKAKIIRNAPLTAANVGSGCPNQGGVPLSGGWSQDVASSAILRKNFQVNAVVLDNSAVGRPSATLEFLQERVANLGNKWGAWFRNDLEVFAGPTFNWNGTMHTEGSFIFGNNTFHAFLISADKSCLFGTDGGIGASDITMTELKDSNTSKTTFQGQLVTGRMRDLNDTSSSVNIHETSQALQFTIGTPPNFQVTQPTDSVGSATTPAQISLDPLMLFTADKSVARNTTDSTNTSYRAPVASSWNKSSLVSGITPPIPGRVSNQFQTKPYVDDTYRADNRYGPKLPPGGLPGTKLVGDLIDPSDPLTPPTTYSNLVNNIPPAGDTDNVGLDGYWERRAYNEGLRVIVGQRLELRKPLDPPTAALSTIRTNEALQRRNLRDDVAAVQATAIYHYGSKPKTSNVDYPVACLATTVHPGTATTLQRSATFQDITFLDASSKPITLNSDFFNGWGTNGWEYNVPDPASFPNYDTSNALRNLANYAGDPYGYYPAKQDSYSKVYAGSTAVTHPYPVLTQAGDFSNLRLAYNNFLNSGSSFSSLSLADQSTLETAACTLGMLAYQVKSLNDFDYTKNNSLLTDLDSAIASGITNKLISSSAKFAEIIAALTKKDLVSGKQQGQLARLLYLKEQIPWDRQSLGTPAPSCGLAALTSLPNLVKLCPSGPVYTLLHYIFPPDTGFTTPLPEGSERLSDQYIKSVNSPSTQTQKSVSPQPYINNIDLDQVKLAPRSPSSWVLGKNSPTSPNPTPDPNSPNNSRQELVTYINSSGTPTRYSVPFKDTALFNGREMMNVRVLNVDLDLLRRTKSPGTDPGTNTWLAASGIVFAFREDAVREDAIARPAGKVTFSNYSDQWKLNYDFGPPVGYRMSAYPTSIDPPVNDTTGISPKPIDYYPDPDRRPYGFRLKNGSDLRRLDPISGNPITSTSGNPISGLSFISDQPVYIQGDSNNGGFNLHQKTDKSALLEEFQASDHLLSSWKNFYSRTALDPDFARAGDNWLPSAVLGDAISILSNNFCDGSIEDGFLTAGNGSNSVTIDRSQYGCTIGGNGYTSYLNQNRPSTAVTSWQRENPLDTLSPIEISPNGNPVTVSSGVESEYNGGYYPFTDMNSKAWGNYATQPDESYINAMIVSGIVPSRTGQSYGGLHNFPRFLENWDGRNLHISGSFIQLNFSSYATAPYDIAGTTDANGNSIGQDSWWESSTQINLPAFDKSDQNFPYRAPNRFWGYDVALQYQPAGPVARRFATSGDKRNEFYKELPVDDPYIQILRCAKDSGGTVVDSSASCP